MSSIAEGGCACGACRYQLRAAPLIVNACHCTDCRRKSGAPYVVNIWIEAENVVATAGEPTSVMLAGGESGQACESWYCPGCGTTLWARYYAAPGNFRWVRAGTLDDPAPFAPDVHVWTRSKLPWVELPAGVPAFETFYRIGDVWPADSRARLRANIDSNTS